MVGCSRHLHLAQVQVSIPEGGIPPYAMFHRRLEAGRTRAREWETLITTESNVPAFPEQRQRNARGEAGTSCIQVEEITTNCLWYDQNLTNTDVVGVG